MNPEEVQPAEAGDVSLLKLRSHLLLPGAEEGPPAVCYCVLKRPGGFLLAVPLDYLPAGLLREATAEGFTGVLGPHVVASAPAVELGESGEWMGVYPPRTLDVLLIDLADSASIALELLEEGIGDCVPFSEEANMLFPLATSLASYAMNWMGGLEGDRGAGYVTAEELIAAEEAPPILGRKAKAEPPKRKPTVAALAAQQTDMLAAIQALSSQVQLLTKANQPQAPTPGAGEGQVPQVQQVQLAPRPVLAAPVSAAIAASPVQPRRLADMLGAPPRAALPKSPHAAAGALEDGPVALAIDGEGAEEGAPLAAALLAQSRALNTLVTQLAGSSDPLSDLGAGSSSSLSVKGSAARLKLQKELHSRTGAFFGRVQEAALRRMEPTANLSVLQEDAQRHSVMTKYLERYGGYRDQRTFGLLQWQLAQAFDLLGSNQTEGAKDVLALAIVMIDQLVSDSGRADLGWILTLQEDPPSTVFSSPQHSSGSVRVCSHLADPKWVAVALSYVKEMETLASRRAEVPRSQPSGPASVEAPAKASPQLNRKQQRAKLWAERKAAAAQPKS